MTTNLRISMDEKILYNTSTAHINSLNMYNIKILKYVSIKIIIPKCMKNMWTIMLGCIVLSLNAISNALSKLCWV